MSRLIFEKNKKYFSILTNKQAASDWIDALYAWLFALDEAHRNALSHLAQHVKLQQQLQVLIYSVTEHKEAAEEKATALFNKLEQVHSKLEEDLPVNMEIPAQRQLPKGALVLVMHSCEMPEGNY